ncbi:lysophospholipid acyltransferase family protein [Phenylobacterium immobile]|uniref:lysophospholipid acyltransferase family protein n=1 Tax=Phenylobacterium immobile TaxID=21 RepID=UPI00159EBCC7|nr:lysophospholipid acyltransferase family protein [Phenylobacterium immobile]
MRLSNRVFGAMARLGGVDIASAAGAGLGVLVAVVVRGFDYRRADARARANWRRCRPDAAGAAETHAAMRRMWRGMGRTLTEIYLLERLLDRVGVEGEAHLRAAQAGGAPVLVAPLHMGNWELLPAMLPRLGCRALGPHQPPRSAADYALISGARDRAGTLTFPAWPGGMKRLQRCLTGGERAAWLFVDDFLGGRVNAPRLDRPGRLAGNLRIAARLGVTTGAAIVPAYMLRTHGAHFRLVFLEPFRMTTSDTRGPGFEAELDRLNAVYEAVVIEHFDQWFWAPQFGAREDQADAPAPMSGPLLDGESEG